MQAKIPRVNPKSLYAHCAGDWLNFAVVALCKEQRVRNIMKLIKEKPYFFNFSVPPKNCLLEKVKVYATNAQLQNLVYMCCTIRLERIDGMSIFEELLVSIYYCLCEMKENKCDPCFNSETWAKVDSRSNLVTVVSFIATLVITRNILGCLLPVTRKLQTKESDIT